MFLNFDLLTEQVITFTQIHIRKIIIFTITACILLFVGIFLSSKQKEKQQMFVQKYVAAQSLLSQKENEKALKGFQYVYNNATGLISTLSLMNIIDILTEDKQYQTLEQMLGEILSIKNDPSILIILYSKALGIFQVLEAANHSFDEQTILQKYYEATQKLKVSKGYIAHKDALLLAFSKGDTLNLSKEMPENNLSETLRLIAKNK